MSKLADSPSREATAGIEFVESDRFEEQVLAAARRVEQGVPHVLLVVKLDHATVVSQECGEEAEAALFDVLRHALDQQIGCGACASRLRADHIAILHPGCLPRDALALGKRVRTALENGQFVWKGLSFRLGASVGVLELDGASVRPSDQVARAARASETAAALGGDGVVVDAGTPEDRLAQDRERGWREHLQEII